MTQTHHNMPQTNMEGDRRSAIIAADSIVKVVNGAHCPALWQAGIFACGYGRFGHPTAFENSPHRLWTLTVCLGGAAEVLHGDRWKPLEAAMAHLSPPGDMKATRTVPQQPWEAVWVRYLPQARHITALFSTSEPAIRAADGSRLRTVVEELHREFRTANDPLAMQHWISLIDLSARRLLAGHAVEPRLHQLWKRVMADLARPWVVGELTEIVGTSEQHLRRLCGTHAGISPMSYVTRLRLDRATVLLAETTEPISRIAGLVGFNSPFAFSRAFARQFGQPPSAFRARVFAPLAP
jgi:AraC family transcriptional regulator, arabinose operon regulatory protein